MNKFSRSLVAVSATRWAAWLVTRLVAWLGAALTAGLVACGGEGTEPTNPGPSSVPASASEAPAQSAEQTAKSSTQQ